MTALVLAALLAVAPADTARAECPGGQVLDRAAIESAGVVYVGDLLRLFDAVRMTTVDGFAWRALAGAPSGGDGLAVLIDGVPAPTPWFGDLGPADLPVPITEVAEVAWCPEPGLAGGRWAGGGTLDVRTWAAASGTTTRLAWQIGNETGDPGPYRYTDRATPNVDKSGPDGEGALLYADSLHAGRVLVRAYRFYPTDLATDLRASAATARAIPKQRVMTGGLDGRTALGGGALGGRVQGRYVSALWFFEPAGRELPVRRLDARLGLDGRTPAGGLDLGYRLTFDTGRLDAEDGTLPGFDPDWRQRTLTAHLDATARTGRATTSGGASFVGSMAGGPGLGSGAGFALGTLYARHERALAERVTATTQAALVTAAGRVRGKAALTVRLRTETRTLSGTLAYDARLPEEDAGYGYWAGRGYTGLLRSDTPYRPLGPPQPGTDLSARLAWTGRLGAALRATASAGLRHSRGLYVERPAFTLAPGDTAVTGPVAAFPDARGTHADARVALDGALGSWRAHVFYSLLAVLDGDAAFRDAWARAPTHRGGLALTFQPDPGLALRLAFTAQSATTWPGYEALDGATEPRGFAYGDGTPPLRLLDVAVEKGLFDRRVRLALSFRNVLQAEERHHPLGAPLDYRLFLRVQAQFRGLPVWRPRGAPRRTMSPGGAPSVEAGLDALGVAVIAEPGSAPRRLTPRSARSPRPPARPGSPAAHRAARTRPAGLRPSRPAASAPPPPGPRS